MINTANSNSPSTVDTNPVPHPTYVPTGNSGGSKSTDSPAEKKIEDVANKAAHKAAKTEQDFDKDQKLFSK